MIWGHGLVCAAGAAGFLLTANCETAAARNDRVRPPLVRIADTSPSEAIAIRVADIAAKGAGRPQAAQLSREELLSILALICARKANERQ